MPPAPLFRFERCAGDLVDGVNGLRVRAYSWPEYNFSVSVEPLQGPQSEAWPLRDRAYFEFAYLFAHDAGVAKCIVSMAVAGPPFELDYPGRSAELLDAVIPLIVPVSMQSFPETDPKLIGEVPDKMIPTLLARGSYYRHRDEPHTVAYRTAHPTALDVACFNKDPKVRRVARILRSVRDRGIRP